MKALEKFTKNTLKEIESGKFTDLQMWIDSLTTYRVKALAEAVGAGVIEAKVCLIEVAERFARRETKQITFTPGERLTYAKRLHEALGMNYSVRQKIIGQRGRLTLTDPNSAQFGPTDKGLNELNNRLGGKEA